MDFNDYWQENKRFVTGVAIGVIVYLIATMMISSSVGTDLNSAKGGLRSVDRDLKEPRYSSADKTRADEQNEALRRAVADLTDLVAFVPRPEFEVDAGRPIGSQYVERVSAVRDDLLRRAGRRKLRLPEDLGLPALAPTRDEEILRHLHALDLIERVVSNAIDLGVERIDKIEIKLDPGLYSRQGVGRVERTRVRMKLSGASGPMVDLLARSQQPDDGASLMIDELEILPERNKTQSSRMEVVFLVPYVQPLELGEGEV
jgi:hypothetical protein